MNHVLLHHDGHHMKCIADDHICADEFGQVTQRRVSHIWPKHPVKRFFFRLLRLLFGERGRVAAWQRTWYGPWTVRLADQPDVVVFEAGSRNACIVWEKGVINAKLNIGDL